MVTVNKKKHINCRSITDRKPHFSPHTLLLSLALKVGFRYIWCTAGLSTNAGLTQLLFKEIIAFILTLFLLS